MYLTLFLPLPLAESGLDAGGVHQRNLFLLYFRRLCVWFQLYNNNFNDKESDGIIIIILMTKSQTRVQLF